MDREIYFAHSNGKIKIGISKNAATRLADLRIGAGGPVTLLGAISGNLATERALHKKLQAHRADREWFHDHPDVRAAIQHCLNHFPPPQVRETRKRTADRFKAVCRIIWPHKTAEHLAAIAGTDRRSGSRWLSGESDPPAIIIAAIIVEITKRA